MIQPYQTCPAEMPNISPVPAPFMKPVSFISSYDSLNPFYPCVDNNQFACVSEVCWLIAAKIGLDHVYERTTQLDEKIQKLFPQFADLGFLNGLTDEKIRDYQSLGIVHEVDEAFKKASGIYQKASNRVWECLADPKEYSHQAKHRSTMMFLNYFQQQSQNIIDRSKEVLAVNVVNIESTTKNIKRSIQDSQINTNLVLTVAVLMLGVLCWDRMSTPVPKLGH